MQNFYYPALAGQQHNFCLYRRNNYKENLQCIESLGEVMFKKELNDLILVIIHRGSYYSLYIVSKLGNTQYFHSLANTIFNPLLQSNKIFLFNGEVIEVSVFYNTSDFSREVDNRYLISHLSQLTGHWIIKKINPYEDLLYLPEIGFLYVGQNNLIKKLNMDGIFLYNNSPYGDRIVQDIVNGIQNEKMLFWDNRYQQHFSYDDIPDFRILEEINNIVKNSEGQ